MKVLHITPSTDGYEEVTLLANRVSRTNGFAVIEKEGEKFYTGGYILQDTPDIRACLDILPKELQFKFVRNFRSEPYAKSYFEE